MSVFDMDRMELALDGMVPAPADKVGMEDEINDAQGAQNRRGPVMHASMRNCFCNLELGKEDNLAEVAQANMLTEDTNNDPADNSSSDNQEAVPNTAL
jgi:hypothetical protein